MKMHEEAMWLTSGRENLAIRDLHRYAWGFIDSDVLHARLYQWDGSSRDRTFRLIMVPIEPLQEALRSVSTR